VCREIASKLRSEGIRTIFNGFSWSLTKHLDDASKRQIPYAAIIGPRELAKKSVNVRDMTTGDEKLVKIRLLANFIKKTLKTRS
jgi:histidyl-tRNA synthetase